VLNRTVGCMMSGNQFTLVEGLLEMKMKALNGVWLKIA